MYSLKVSDKNDKFNHTGFTCEGSKRRLPHTCDGEMVSFLERFVVLLVLKFTNFLGFYLRLVYLVAFPQAETTTHFFLVSHECWITKMNKTMSNMTFLDVKQPAKFPIGRTCYCNCFPRFSPTVHSAWIAAHICAHITLHCITLHYTTFHAIPLHSIPLHCIALYCTGFRSTPLHYIALAYRGHFFVTYSKLFGEKFVSVFLIFCNVASAHVLLTFVSFFTRKVLPVNRLQMSVGHLHLLICTCTLVNTCIFTCVLLGAPASKKPKGDIFWHIKLE